MSYVTPYDSLTEVERTLNIPALDIADNFFPVDAVSGDAGNKSNGKSKSKNQAENVFTIKMSNALPAMVTYKSYDVDRVSQNPYMKPVYPSATKAGKAIQFKSEFIDRVTNGDVINDEPCVVITQVFKTNGSPINTGVLTEKRLLEHFASVVSLGKSTDAIDAVQLDRMINGGAAPIGLR